MDFDLFKMMLLDIIGDYDYSGWELFDNDYYDGEYRATLIINEFEINIIYDFDDNVVDQFYIYIGDLSMLGEPDIICAGPYPGLKRYDKSIYDIILADSNAFESAKNFIEDLLRILPNIRPRTSKSETIFVQPIGPESE